MKIYTDLADLNKFLKSKGLPPFISVRNIILWTHPVSGKKMKFPIYERWFMPRSDIDTSKMFYVIERFQDLAVGAEKVRIGYYIIGKRPAAKGKWVWAQFCPWYKQQDLETILPLLRKLSETMGK